MGVRIPSKAVQQGYNFDQSAYRDNMQVRCSRCGFICNLDRDMRSHPTGSEGWGTTFVAVEANEAGNGYGATPWMQTSGPNGQILYSSSYGPSDYLTNNYGNFSFGSKGLLQINGASTGLYGFFLLLYNGNMYTQLTTTQNYMIADDVGVLVKEIITTIPTFVVQDNSSNNVADDSSNLVSVINDAVSTQYQVYDDSGINTWNVWNGEWFTIFGDPRINQPYVEQTMDSVVNAGCPQCGTLLYNNPAHWMKG